MARSKGRTGRPWRRLRQQVINTEHICIVCWEPVDKTLRFPHPKSPSVDHKIPLSRGGPPLPPRSGVGLAHFGCNSGKKNRPPKPRPPRPRTSRNW